MTTTSERPASAFRDTVLAYASSDIRILWRLRTVLAFMFVIPAVLSLTLGPAVSGNNDPAVRGRTMLGIAVLFSFITVNYMGLALFREFTHHTWVRQAVLRPHRLAYLLGKALPVAGCGLLQLGIFGCFAFFVYDTPLHGSVVQLVLVAFVLVCAGCATGAALYTITRSTQAFQSLAYVVLLTTGSVGGAIVPSERLPEWSQVLGYGTPQYWALRALDAATTGTGDWAPTVQALLAVGGLAVVLGGVSIAAFGYHREKSAES